MTPAINVTQATVFIPEGYLLRAGFINAFPESGQLNITFPSGIVPETSSFLVKVIDPANSNYVVSSTNKTLTNSVLSIDMPNASTYKFVS